MKVSRLLCSLLPVQADHAATASSVLELAEYFEAVRISQNITKRVEARFSQI